MNSIYWSVLLAPWKYTHLLVLVAFLWFTFSNIDILFLTLQSMSFISLSMIEFLFNINKAYLWWIKVHLILTSSAILFLYICRDNLDDPLDDTATVFQQLEQLCTVSRCEYEKTCTLLVQLFDQNAQNYQKLLHSASGITVDMAIQEGQ